MPASFAQLGKSGNLCERANAVGLDIHAWATNAWEQPADSTSERLAHSRLQDHHSQ